MAALSACAPGPGVAPPAAPSARIESPAPASPSLLARAGQAGAPTRAEIEAAFGPADIVRQDGAGAALTYRLESCGLLLLFAADERNALRLADASASARSGAAQPPALSRCEAEAAARRR